MNYMDQAHQEILDHIRHIVRTCPDMDFQRGDCFQFYKIISVAYPEAEPFYDPVKGHVYVMLMNRLWDSNGLHLKPLKSDIETHERAHQWTSKT